MSELEKPRRTLCGVEPRVQAQLSQLEKRINESHGKAEARLKSGLKYALQAGESLRLARKLVPHGQWTNWFHTRDFVFSISSAERYMRLHRKWKKVQKEIGKTLPQLDELTMTQALDVLADPNRRKIITPELVIGPETSVRAIKKADRIDPVTQSEDKPANITPADPPMASVISEPSKLDSWLTPAFIRDAVIETLGVIDLDPASDGDNVAAESHYTAADNGLEPSHPWKGRIFLNPPLSTGLITRFVDRLLSEHASSQLSEAIVLVPAWTDRDWFRRLACFVRAFIAKPQFGTTGFNEPLVAIYLGERESIFFQSFQSIGDVYQPFRRGSE